MGWKWERWREDCREGSADCWHMVGRPSGSGMARVTMMLLALILMFLMVMQARRWRVMRLR